VVTPGHLGIELFQMMSSTRMVHVPFSGGAPGLAALVGGQVQLMAGVVAACWHSTLRVGRVLAPLVKHRFHGSGLTTP